MSNVECYLNYVFDLEDSWITDETLKDTEITLHMVGLESPIHFDDFMDSWKHNCRPVFVKKGDEERITTRYFRQAYQRGEKQIMIELEHNPLQNTHATKYSRIRVRLFEEEETGRVLVNVMWENNPDLERTRQS